MHLSTHNWMRAEPLEVTLKRIKRLGFESIEISGEPDQYKPSECLPLLKEYGIRCWGAVTLTLGDRNLAAKDPAQRAATVDYFKSLVEMVHQLEGTELTIVPATVGKVNPDATPDEEWGWVVAGLQEVYELAEERGVRMALEPLNRFETYFLNRADQAMALAEAVGPNCGVCLDVFHMNIEEKDMHAALRASKSRLVDVHVAENNRLAPGMGSVDWKAFVETLKDIGYDGALTMEAVAPIDRTPVSPWTNQVEQNPVDISPEQLKFIEDHGSSLLSEEYYTMLYETASETLLPLIR
ncbi:MAG: sugar phosphate isomerase/epimerase [Planctomycetota bacterium]|nr:sugar phosphate isomerase/epimerase [Planctomycetota bacterium]MEC8494548.1 sugar phosphate isomerase/epimerase [Planctomycetota bacterium]MEC8510796.1 sugar phosphate isomerase/epimerase [Planctomycetota bacterium]